MPAPVALTPYVRRFVNPLTVHLAGHGWFVELEHVGRRSGTVRRTPMFAFRHGDLVTIALTYGPDVQWLKNVRAAGGCRMHQGRSMLALGPPRTLTTQEGVARMPQPIRWVFARTGACEDFVELPVLGERPFHRQA